MEGYKVSISPSAQNDLIEIEAYLVNQDPEEAIRYITLFTEKIKTLTKSPDKYPPARDMQMRLRGYRMLFIENYIVFYVHRNSTVELRRILYARRQYENLI